MIIDDDVNEPNPLKGPQSQSSLPPSHESLEPLLPPSPPPYFSYQAIPPPVLAPRKKPRSRRHRLRRKYIFVASFVLNCLLLVLLVRIIRRVSGPEYSEPADTEIPDHKPPVIRAVIPDPQLGRCIRNAQWSNATRLSAENAFPFSSDASFQFRDLSSFMFFVAQGALSGGHLNVLPSSDSVPRALLTVRYHSLHVRDRANICWMERKHTNGEGIGIFTPSPFDGQALTDRLDFSISLFLPTGSAPASLPIYNLETQLPSFAHSLDSLRGLLEFNNLVLRSHNKPITAQSVFARNATIQTSNGLISGSFDASSSLSLVTSNAPIDAAVSLHSNNIFSTTELVLQTRNAELQSAVSLITSSATGEGGKFAVKAQTADGPLIMTFPASPAHSALDLEAKTSNSPADVWLNHAFEGQFTLASNMVFVDKRPFLDPRKLRSVFCSDYQNGRVVGNVRWKLPIFKSKVQGSVRVATTNHILKLYV
ncbi:hypothetical protein C8R43DRAFT_1024244 [Mycena crocata]|nr:hypothetical protein C8R43DRAFT_1024244 [Mycena crocata]